MKGCNLFRLPLKRSESTKVRAVFEVEVGADTKDITFYAECKARVKGEKLSFGRKIEIITLPVQVVEMKEIA